MFGSLPGVVAKLIWGMEKNRHIAVNADFIVIDFKFIDMILQRYRIRAIYVYGYVSMILIIVPIWLTLIQLFQCFVISHDVTTFICWIDLKNNLSEILQSVF